MIYLVKKICTECNMKIELNDEHFGIDLACPNCDADISIPDVNKVAEEKERLAKEIEELKKDSKFTQTNTITMGRPGQTLKVQTAGVNDADLLKKERALTAQLKKEEQVLNGKLKGLQAANMSMNAELTTLKGQKEEFNKSLSTIKELQRQLDEKNKEADQLKAKLDKYTQLTKSLKEITTVGQADVISNTAFAETMAAPVESSEELMAETMAAPAESSEELMAETMAAPVESSEELMAETMAAPELDACFAETMAAPAGLDIMTETIGTPEIRTEKIGKERFDETLQVSMEAVKVTERECSHCGIDYVYTAKFCPKCNTRNETYTD